MHPHIKFGSPLWNSTRFDPDTIFLKTKSEDKVTVTQKWYVTLRHSKMHSHTKFRIPTSKNIWDMHQNRCQFYKLCQRSRSLSQWPKDGSWHFAISWCMHTPNLGFLLKWHERYASDTIILKTMSEVKVTVTRKWYATLCHPNIHPHTKFRIPSLSNIGDMHRTWSGMEGQTGGQCDYHMPPKVPLRA